jgi:hypothetical protein
LPLFLFLSNQTTTEIFTMNPEESHHPDCPAVDGFGCRCEELAALCNPYTERGLEDRTKPIRELQTFAGWTDAQITAYFESN